MANYYNVTLYKRTGFDFYNRPFSPKVLNQSPFTDDNMYAQVQGIFVKRDDTSGLQYIDVQGSVKDFIGEQINEPNITGSQGGIGVLGPWFSLEEVDYVRTVRTGYPGDTDFIDITGNMSNPSDANSSDHKQLRIGYYFVTGLQPLSRNVTRVYLKLDAWTSFGGADELIIESGFKVRGHISDEEDLNSYNTSPEPIGLIEPMEIISYGDATPALTNSTNNFYVASAIDLTKYASDTIDGIIAQATSGATMVFPKVPAFDGETKIEYTTAFSKDLLDSSGTYTFRDYGIYDLTNSYVQLNLSALYSVGQAEMEATFVIPVFWNVASESAGSSGRMSSLRGLGQKVSSVVTKDISGEFPRKADYLYGQEVLMSLATGAMDVENFYDLENDDIVLWAVCTPTGCPYARFDSIKGTFFTWDRAVAGMQWLSTSVMIEGASGSIWNNLSNYYAQNELDIQKASTKLSQKTGLISGIVDTVGGVATSVINLLSGGVATSAKNLLSGSGAEGVGGLFGAVSSGISTYEGYKTSDFEIQSQELQKSQKDIQTVQANYQAPFVDFVPDIGKAALVKNGFAVYVVNTGTKDRTRLRNFFKRWGYSGLYEPLTFETMMPRQNMSFVQAEGVQLRHAYYSMRDLMPISILLAEGCTFWNVQPSQEAIDNNPSGYLYT